MLKLLRLIFLLVLYLHCGESYLYMALSSCCRNLRQRNVMQVSSSHLVCVIDATFLVSICPNVIALEPIYFPLKVTLGQIKNFKLHYICVGYCVNVHTHICAYVQIICTLNRVSHTESYVIFVHNMSLETMKFVTTLYY